MDLYLDTVLARAESHLLLRKCSTIKSTMKMNAKCLQRYGLFNTCSHFIFIGTIPSAVTVFRGPHNKDWSFDNDCVVCSRVVDALRPCCV
jgi:hypothetical protein